MNGEIMHGICEICGADADLKRTTFYYPIKCECHSPQHFISIEHCKDCKPQEPQYTKVEYKTEDLKNPIPLAMEIIRKELAADKSEGSWYYSWQSNIACTVMDNSDIEHDKANEIAIKFLEMLIR